MNNFNECFHFKFICFRYCMYNVHDFIVFVFSVSVASLYVVQWVLVTLGT